MKTEKFIEKNIHHLNLGTPIISLLSTGLDSPVSTYLMMKQGFDCISLSFLNGNEKSIENKNKIIKIGKKIRELTNMLWLHYQKD